MRVTIKKPQEFEAKYRKENAIRTNEVNTLYQQFKCVWLTNIKIAFGTKTQKSKELMKELLAIPDFFKIGFKYSEYPFSPSYYPINGFIKRVGSSQI